MQARKMHEVGTAIILENQECLRDYGVNIS